MKKFLAIFILAFIFSGNANAGVNEPGSGPILSIEAVEKIYKEHLPKAKKEKKHLIYYVSTNESGNWGGWAFYAKKINKIFGPIGIKLGGKSAPEIALSIIAQLVSEVHNK